MGNVFGCQKKDTSLRKQLILGNMEPYFMDSVTIYDDTNSVWTHSQKKHRDSSITSLFLHFVPESVHHSESILGDTLSETCR